jgi:hypothetical protein
MLPDRFGPASFLRLDAAGCWIFPVPGNGLAVVHVVHVVHVDLLLLWVAVRLTVDFEVALFLVSLRAAS